MNTLAVWLLGALTTLRVTRLITEDVILASPRDWLTARLPDKLGYLLTCAWCGSVYVAAGLVLALMLLDVSVPLPAFWVASWSYITGAIASLIED